MLHQGAAHSFPNAHNVPMACVREEADGQGALPASVLRALHTTTETETQLPHTHQHKAEAGGIIPPRFMTNYARAATSQSGIATRLISDDGGLATGTGMTDHTGRLLRRLHMGLALLGETDGGRFHGRISGLGLSTDYDFGEPAEQWQKSASGASTLIFVLRPATTCPDETVDMITVGLQTFGHDGLAAHGRPKEVCLLEGLPPKKIEKNNSSALEICTDVTSVLTGRGRAEAARTEGVRRCYSVAHPWLANAHVQEQRFYGTGDVGRTDTAHQARTGRRTEGPSQSVDGITSLVCSLTSHGVWTRISCLPLPPHRRLQLPCWEAQFSGRWSFASPALCWDSDDHRLASTRGTPGFNARLKAALLKMATTEATSPSASDAEMQTAETGKRYSETVASFHILDLPESARSDKLAPMFNKDISWLMSGPFHLQGNTDAEANQLSLRMTRGWALFCGYVGANFTFWMHSKRSQQQEGHRLSWKSLVGGRPSATPASYLVSGSHLVAWARDPSLWYFYYRPAPQELMSAEASSLEHRLEYGGQL
jgi:hypothetical protein